MATNVVNVSGQITQLIGTPGSGTSTAVVVNLDQANTLYVSDTSNPMPGQPNTFPLQPGASISYDGVQGVWAVTSGPVIQAALLPAGTQYFLPASLSRLGGVKVYIQQTKPADPHPPQGSLWLETNAAGTVIGFEIWDGSDWQAQEFDASQILSAGTIVADLIASGTIVAGIVNGTTITGANFVATGSSGDILAYSGTPAVDNLVASVSPVSGTSPVGAEFYDGICSYGPDGTVIQISSNHGTTEPSLQFKPGGTTASQTNAQVSVQALNAGEANELTQLIVVSGEETDRDAAFIALSSQSADGSTAPGIIMGHLNTAIGSEIDQLVLGPTGNIFTLAINIADPVAGFPTAETWHHAAGNTNWSASGNGVNGFYYRASIDGNVDIAFDMTYSGTAIAAGSSSIMIATGVIPARYAPNQNVQLPSCSWYNNSTNPVIYPVINSNGSVSIWARGSGSLASGASVAGVYRYPLGAV